MYSHIRTLTGASVLLIHSMLLVERQRVESLENQILLQQKVSMIPYHP